MSSFNNGNEDKDIVCLYMAILVAFKSLRLLHSKNL